MAGSQAARTARTLTAKAPSAKLGLVCSFQATPKTAALLLASTYFLGACSLLFSVSSNVEEGDASQGTADATAVFDASQADARANVAICVNGSCSVSVRLEDGAQDVSQVLGGALNFGEEILSIGDVDGNTTPDEFVGFRFQNLDIPMGAGITDARIQFASAEQTTSHDVIILRFEDSSLAAPFSKDQDLEERSQNTISSLSTTWNLQSPGGDWEINESGLPQRTPIFFGAMQHLVNRSDWTRTDNAIVVLARGMLGSRRVRAYESGAANGATIFVQYDEP